jgi:hypothetical protein
MNTQLYEYTCTHSIFMSASERLSQLDLETYEVGHQERLTVDGDAASTERIITVNVTLISNLRFESE